MYYGETVTKTPYGVKTTGYVACDGKAKVYFKDGKYSYFDKNGNEIKDGDIIVYDSGREEKVYLCEDGELGIDATSKLWIANGRAIPCEWGLYALELEDCKVCTVKGSL